MKFDLDAVNKARRSHGAEPLAVPKRGRPAIGPRPSGAEIVELYQRRGLSLRAAAEVLGISKDAVWRGLSEQGIEARPHVRPSRLAAYSLGELRRRVKRDGLRPTARALDVNWATLRDFLKRREDQ